MQRLLLVALAIAPAEAALELTKDSFKHEVKDSGKNAFVKFLAPWSVHARACVLPLVASPNIVCEALRHGRRPPAILNLPPPLPSR